MRIVALLYALSWFAVRGMLVCGCPASKGGILRAISPAGRRFRASALVSGRTITMYIPYMCTFFLVVAFRDARFLSGLYGRFSYIVHTQSHSQSHSQTHTTRTPVRTRITVVVAVPIAQPSGAIRQGRLQLYCIVHTNEPFRLSSVCT